MPQKKVNCKYIISLAKIGVILKNEEKQVKIIEDGKVVGKVKRFKGKDEAETFMNYWSDDNKQICPICPNSFSSIKNPECWIKNLWNQKKLNQHAAVYGKKLTGIRIIYSSYSNALRMLNYIRYRVPGNGLNLKHWPLVLSAKDGNKYLIDDRTRWCTECVGYKKKRPNKKATSMRKLRILHHLLMHERGKISDLKLPFPNGQKRDFEKNPIDEHYIYRDEDEEDQEFPKYLESDEEDEEDEKFEDSDEDGYFDENNTNCSSSIIEQLIEPSESTHSDGWIADEQHNNSLNISIPSANSTPITKTNGHISSNLDQSLSNPNDWTTDEQQQSNKNLKYKSSTEEDNDSSKINSVKIIETATNSDNKSLNILTSILAPNNSTSITKTNGHISSDLDQSLSNPNDWTTDEVISFLKIKDPSLDYAELFKQHEINGKAFLLLNSDMLMKYMRIKFGPALQISSIIENLKQKLLN